ncbi:MAG: hypothetical protein IJZ54_06935 [Clostridia bacterium]|nr:hypothetical protein [Clostridia bacterium]
MKKIKDWLVRKLGGYRTVYAEKVVVKKFNGERVNAIVEVPREYLIYGKTPKEEIRRRIAGELAEHIVKNMPDENISTEEVVSRDKILYSAKFWIDYDCDLQRRSDERSI